MDPNFLKDDTLALHAGYTPDPTTGAVAVPIYQTTAYEFDDTSHAAALFNLERSGNLYTRLQNPTVAVLEERIAALHGGVGCLATASGHAALHLAIVTLMSAGDHIVASRAVYGGSVNFLKLTMPRFGIETTFVDPNKPEEFEAAIRPNTKMILGEVVGNPGLDVMDVDAIAEIAKRHQVPLLIDNTFLSPSLFKPLEHGANLVMESATKWIGGHGNSLGGLLIDGGNFDWSATMPDGSPKFPNLTEPYAGYNNIRYAETFGPIAFTMRGRTEGLRDFGAALAPHNAFLLLQGVETLSMRMKRHMENCYAVLDFLKGHDLVTWLRHPSLEDFPGHDIAERLLPEGAGSMIAFGLKGGRESGKKFIENVQLMTHVANVGDSRTLVTHPATTTHMQVGAEVLKTLGVGEDMVRLSVGLEDPKDIIADLSRAMKISQKPAKS